MRALVLIVPHRTHDSVPELDQCNHDQLLSDRFWSGAVPEQVHHLSVPHRNPSPDPHQISVDRSIKRADFGWPVEIPSDHFGAGCFYVDLKQNMG